MDELAPSACVRRSHVDCYHDRRYGGYAGNYRAPTTTNDGRIQVTPAPSNYGRSLYMDRLARADVADTEVKAAIAWLKSGGTGTYRSAA